MSPGTVPKVQTADGEGFGDDDVDVEVSEHIDEVIRAHSSTDTFSLCNLPRDKHNFLTVDISEASLSLGTTRRTSFLRSADDTGQGVLEG